MFNVLKKSKKDKKEESSVISYKDIKRDIKKVNEKLNVSYDKLLVFEGGKKINADYVVVEEEKDDFGNKKQYVVYSYYNVKKDIRIERKKPIEKISKIFVFGYNKDGYFNKLIYSKHPPVSLNTNNP